MNLTFVCGQVSIEATNKLSHFKWVCSGISGHAQSKAKW